MRDKPMFAKSLNELYNIPGLYSSPDMFSPPAERLGHVIRFELTQGCSWRRCTFCGGYDGVRHSIKSPEDYIQHVKKVFDLIGRRSALARGLRRIFIGGGNALALDTEILHELLDRTITIFKDNTGYDPHRLSLYGRTDDILRHGEDGLRELRMGKITKFFPVKSLPGVLNLIYWGVESGSDEILTYVNKGCTSDEMKRAAEIIKYAVVDASVMIMPGLGGIKYYDQHIEKTAALLGKIQPRFLTFMGVNVGENSIYAKKMQHEMGNGENRPLTPRETAIQMLEIIERMPSFFTKIGCFNDIIDSVGCNPVTFGSHQVHSISDKNSLVRWLAFRIADRFPE